MTPAEFFLAFRGFQKSEWKKWEHTRTIAYTVYASAPKKKNRRTPTMYQWMPLPIDSETGPDEDHMRAVLDKVKKRKQKDHG